MKGKATTSTMTTLLFCQQGARPRGVARGVKRGNTPAKVNTGAPHGDETALGTSNRANGSKHAH